jgi:hypothetical protein
MKVTYEFDIPKNHVLREHRDLVERGLEIAFDVEKVKVDMVDLSHKDLITDGHPQIVVTAAPSNIEDPRGLAEKVLGRAQTACESYLDGIARLNDVHTKQ